MDMQYRRLGRSGLKVSVLSFGSWVTFGSQLDVGLARDCLAAAHDAGVNFFDNAEVYAGGQSEAIMGKAIAELGWPRHSFVVSSKYFLGIHDSVTARSTLNRKYLTEAIDPSLERMQLDHLDIIYAHRADHETPIDETVWAMSDIISSGKALYWGTSGLLTGKYADGVPEGSRATLPGYEWLRRNLTDADRNAKVLRLSAIADELGCTLAQLAIAWCARNPRVSTVITGASRVEQVEENMGALDVLERLDDETAARIAKTVA